MRTLFIALCTAFLLCSHASAKPTKKKPQPAFSAKSFIVADGSGSIIKEKQGNTVRPIASISKLLVALLAAEQDLTEDLIIPSKRSVQSKIPSTTKTMSREDLLKLSLVKSDNFAAQILCDNIPNCVPEMNIRALSIGMTNTVLQEPTGLSSGNVSTANDLLKLVLVSAQNPVISEISGMPTAEIRTPQKLIKINNTNPLTHRMNILLSKTGFTNPAGGCLVMVLGTGISRRIFVLLGSKNSKARIPDMLKLIKES